MEDDKRTCGTVRGAYSCNVVIVGSSHDTKWKGVERYSGSSVGKIEKKNRNLGTTEW